MVKDLTRRLSERRLTIELGDGVEDYIIQNGYDSAYGARPLKRFIQKALETPIARLLIAEPVPDGSVLYAKMDGDEIAVEARPAPVPVEA